MKAILIGKPHFVELPSELGTPRSDQLRGSDADKIIETAGRTCYDSFGKGRGSHDYSQHILESGHGSVLEHAVFTFFITGVSRGLTHELVRHRVGVAISQRSTRFVDEGDSPWIMHPLMRQYIDATEDRKLESDWNLAVGTCQSVYRKAVEKLQEYVAQNPAADRLSARKQARGAARGILGNALETELVWSANVRALRMVIQQRASQGADAEIRALAMELLRIMQDQLPAYFVDFIVSPSSTDGLGDVAWPGYPKV